VERRGKTETTKIGEADKLKNESDKRMSLKKGSSDKEWVRVKRRTKKKESLIKA